MSNGILKTSGVVLKISPGPLESPVSLNTMTAGTTRSPDKNATEVSVRQIVWADLSMLTCFLM